VDAEFKVRVAWQKNSAIDSGKMFLSIPNRLDRL
jgi:hypothetical protein